MTIQLSRRWRRWMSDGNPHFDRPQQRALHAQHIVIDRVHPHAPPRCDMPRPVETVVASAGVFDEHGAASPVCGREVDHHGTPVSLCRRSGSMNRYSERRAGSTKASGSTDRGFGSVHPSRSLSSRSRGTRPFTLRTFRTNAASPGRSPSASMCSSDSTVRANPTVELLKSISCTVEVSTQMTFLARL